MQPGLVTFTQLGQFGRLGNQLFQIAATIALARKNGIDYRLPAWSYSQHLLSPPEQGPVNPDIEVWESTFHYCDITLDRGLTTDLKGYFQSEKYFEQYAPFIREKLAFSGEVKRKMSLKYPLLSHIPQKCAVHVRRGDYVNNADYAQVPLEYYLEAIKLIPEGGTFIVFSDDTQWCREYLKFPGRRILYIEGNSDIEDLCLMSRCQHFIIPNSTFGWWGAWLGEKHDSIVVAPNEWFSPAFELTHNSRDIIPSRWHRLAWRMTQKTHEKIDLRDVTFTIPVSYDHPDRAQNLCLVLEYLNHHFDTHIRMIEVGDHPRIGDEIIRRAYSFPQTIYTYLPRNLHFHRTRYLNQMALEAQTPIIANWDADVLCAPEQILAAVEKIRQGAAGCYPYDGRFMNVNRAALPALQDSLDVRTIIDGPLNYRQIEVTSFGGAVLWSKAAFLEGGMENERMISYGPEDYERYDRFIKLGYLVERINGPLFHLDHWRGSDSSDKHQHFQRNTTEYERIRQLSKAQLAAEIQGWHWLPRPVIEVPPGSCCPLQVLELDAIYLVNLKRRPERLASATRELQKIGLPGVQVYSAIDGPALKLSHSYDLTPGMLGCFQTHRAIIREALERGYHRILIFEDDMKLIGGFNELMAIALPQLPADWQFAYLGYTEYGGFGTHKKQVSDNWVIPNCGWGTQGYMIRSREALQKVYEGLQEQKMQLDEQLTQLILPYSGLKYYACFPSVVDQHIEFDTDIQIVDKNA